MSSPIPKMVTSNYSQQFVQFLNNSPTPYHAVASIKRHLQQHEFQELKESESWDSKVVANGRYYVTRNGSSIIAFCVGGQWRPGNPMAITGAHTDSPLLRIKPISKRTNQGFQQVGIECYGGGIWHSWFDSDLAVAGRVMVQEEDRVVAKLVDLKRPLLKIPTLAIHLDREVNQKFEFNKESELLPIAGLTGSQDGSSSCCGKGTNADNNPQFQSLKKIFERHHQDFLDLIAEDLKLKTVEDIVDFELVLYDHKPSCLGGMKEEFVYSGRLDNLTSCFTSMHGLTLAAGQNLQNEIGLRVLSCFDHEEIGSSSAQGADSNFLPNILERLNSLPFKDRKNSTPLHTAYAQSFFMSSDVAHGVHPNYSSKYESAHLPQLGKGPVIKINANQRYMTNSPGLALIKQLADAAKVPLQLFVVKNDSPCGSTIGPILASKTGIRTLDLGNPILSMHSIRETGGSEDIRLQTKLFLQFFADYTSLYGKINVD